MKKTFVACLLFALIGLVGLGTSVSLAADAASMVNINTASVLQLQELPGIGPSLAERIVAYRDANGFLPTFSDYVSLADVLCPVYMTPLIRLDAWRNPLFADRTGDRVRIRSSGMDGRSNTSDDLELIRTFQP